MDSSGVLADPTIVTLIATDSTGHTIGTFSELTPAARDSGQIRATAKFNPDGTAAPGPATITATVGPVTGTVVIQLQ